VICIFHSHILVCLLQAQRYVLLVYHHHVLMKYKISSDVGPIFGNSTQTLFIPLNLQFSQVCSKVTEIRTSKFRTNLFTSLCLSACFQRTRMPHPQNILCHTHQTYYATSRGVTRLDGARGKKQVWSPAPPCSSLRSFGSKYSVFKKVLVTLLGLLGAPRRHSAPLAVIWRHHSDSAPGEFWQSILRAQQF